VALGREDLDRLIRQYDELPDSVQVPPFCAAYELFKLECNRIGHGANLPGYKVEQFIKTQSSKRKNKEDLIRKKTGK